MKKMMLNMRKFDGSPDHPRWDELFQLVLLGCVVGFWSGVAAIGFRYAIAFFHNLAFNATLSFNYPQLEYTSPSPWGSAIIFIPVAGALAVSFLVIRFAPNAHTHGVSEVMEAIYFKKSKIRPLLAPVKILSSAISIGTGGSLGREGPIIQICAAIGSKIGDWFKVPERVRGVLLAAAAAGGIAGSFDTPMAGILFSVELLLPIVSASSLMTVALSSLAATVTTRLVFGYQPVLPFYRLLELEAGDFLTAFPLLLGFGLLCGLFSVIFIKGVVESEDYLNRKIPNYFLRHSLGMLLVGVEIYLFMRYSGHYYIEGLGYPAIYSLLYGQISGIAILSALIIGKLLATCLTLGSGGSGGIICPALFVGAALGALWSVFANALLPAGLQIPTAALVLAGMAAMVGGITGAVLTGVVMVAELTGNNQSLLAAFIVSVITFAVRRCAIGGGIYTQKLLKHDRTIPEGLQSSVISSLRVEDLMRPLAPNESPSPGIRWLKQSLNTDASSALNKLKHDDCDAILVMDGDTPIGTIQDHELAQSYQEIASRLL